MNWSDMVDIREYDFQYGFLQQMEKQAQGPFYIFDEARLNQNLQMIRDALPSGIKVCFSMKANPWLVETLKDTIDYLEICSPGELGRCKELKVKGQKMVLDGLMKTDAEIRQAVCDGVSSISIDSVEQMDQVERVAREEGKNGVQILLRLSSGNQFGMDKEEILSVLRNKNRYPHLSAIGIHYYSGTQKKNERQVQKEYDILNKDLDEIKAAADDNFRILELGGGCGLAYFKENNTEDKEKYRQVWETTLRNIERLSACWDVVYEVGRLLAASSGIYVTRIIQKKARDDKDFLIVNGGSNHFSYYGQTAGLRTPYIQIVSQKQGLKIQKKTVICGSLCTSQDILIGNSDQYGDIEDYVVFYLTGAYSVTECCSDFLSRSRPALFLLKEGEKQDVFPWRLLRESLEAQF